MHHPLNALARSAARRMPSASCSRVLAALAMSVAVATVAGADTRCGTALQNDVCLEATGTCPAFGSPGPANSPWPLFQQNVQHTGKSPVAGPTCSKQIWQQKIRGKILSTPAIAEDGTLYVASAKNPICALNPANGAVYYCGTDNIGKLPDYSAPAIGNADFLYVGTRDNDLWAIDLPPTNATEAPVAWRQKVCTDGDITTSPAIGSDGIVYMGSDSLGGGTIMAMCPGSTRQIKWCINPLGGGIRDVSPALDTTDSTLYVTYNGTTVLGLDAETGVQQWKVELETQVNGVRGSNYTPVVDPTTGKIYVGLDHGLYVVTPPASLPGTATSQLLYPTYSLARQSMYSPPALDTANGTIFFMAAQGQRPTFYATDFNGNLKWKKDDTVIGRGRGRNTPPVIDANGNVYFVTKKQLFAFDKNGNQLFMIATPRQFESAPILASGRLYVGSVDGTVTAIGDCP
jgi:outer membrane protein assembly factor BamB